MGRGPRWVKAMAPSTLVEDEEPDEPPGGALETGLWCSRCLLPSAVRFAAMQVDLMGRPVQVGTVILCMDCGAQCHDGDPAA